MQAVKPITALYARISNDDELQGDSNSIIHQKEILEEFAVKNGFDNYRFYVDDGISGTTFERAGFQQMIEDVENGSVCTVIVKDMSRFGRNYLKVGYYTEVFFAEYDVRFIAINDGVDNAHDQDDFTPIRNLFNEFYARDISRKQKAVIQHKGNSGKRLLNQVLYGYKIDADGNWIIDEPAAETVRIIFELYTRKEYGLQQIANYLYAKRILCPTAYQGRIRPGSVAEKNPYIWCVKTISGFLERQEYCGDTVNFKWEKKSYKSKKIIKHDRSEYKIFPDTHEAIIDRETFEIALKKRSEHRRVSPIKEPVLFAGYLFCADCKRTMYIMRTKSQKVSYDNFYLCSKYRKIVNACTAHYIKEPYLIDYILRELTELLKLAKESNSFRQQITQDFIRKNKHSVTEQQEKIHNSENRIRELDTVMKRLYEDKLNGEIPNELFSKLSNQFLQEQKALNCVIEDAFASISKIKKSISKIDCFFAAIDKYDVISKIDRTVLSDFIDRIEVHEGGEKHARNRTPKIDIYYKGIGLFKVNELTSLNL